MMTAEEKNALILARIEEVAASEGKELDLSGLGLSTIPTEVFALEKLETFKFMRNKLEEVPYGLTNLRYLKALYLSSNQITEISKRFLVDLPYLDCLDLGDNPFDYNEAAAYFYENNPWKGYADCLKDIEMGHRFNRDTFMHSGSLNIFPKEVYGLTHITSLSIYGTYIKEIPFGIGRLSELKHLSLSGNELKELPDDIVELKKLEYINLAGNKFDKFPDILLELPALKHIHLEANNIEYFPIEVLLDERFENVNASDNPIRNFNSGLLYSSMEEIRQRLRS
jgi:Leucine-rich repeat (LRR) protein